MIRQYVRIRSWHVIRLTRSGQPFTLCGRVGSGEIRDLLPAEKSCETCLRIIARQDDAA